MEKLQTVLDLEQSSPGVKVAAMEALMGLNLALRNDDSSSVLADKCLERWGRTKMILSMFVLEQLKGYGNTESAVLLFQGFKDDKGCVGKAALSFGEFLHATGNLSLTKDLYQKVVDEVPEKKDFTDMHVLSACNMSSDEVLLASICALGQLEAHVGKFNNAEETWTKALNNAEQVFGKSIFSPR